MNEIRPLHADDKVVTLSRRDYDALLEAAEDARDGATFRAWDARVAAGGLDAALAGALPAELVERLLLGESPVRIWREHRGLTQRALAAQAGMTVSYLSEIETGRKPGSLAAMMRLAGVLRIPVEDLVPLGAA